MKVVDAITKETAKKFVTKAVKKGCIVTTDGYSVYPSLREEGYHHMIDS